MGTSLMLSVPPAMPASISPAEIFVPTSTAAERLVPQARWISKAGVSGARPEDSVDSRARFQSLACLMTAPSETSPRRSPVSPNRSTSAERTLLIICWLEHLRYAVCERANGIRRLPTTATGRAG